MEINRVTITPALYDSGYCGSKYTDDWKKQVIWTLDESGHMTIRGVGYMRAYGSPEDAPWHQYRGKIKTLTIMGSVESIGRNAFRDCPNLESVVFQTAEGWMRTIGANAFYHCPKLTKIVLPEGLQTIGIAAFAWCTGLASVVFPSNMPFVEREAFVMTPFKSSEDVL